MYLTKEFDLHTLTLLTTNAETKLLFGNEKFRDAERFFFEPESVFAVAKKVNSTQEITILRACSVGQVGHTVSYISPGAEILLQVRAAWAQKLLDTLNILHEYGILLEEVSAQDYLALNSRLQANMPLNILTEKWREKYHTT